MAHAEDFAPKDKRPAQPPRKPRATTVEQLPRPVGTPRRSRANEITAAIGLTPIIGRSGPRIAY